VTETLRVDEVGLVGQVGLVRPKKRIDFRLTDFAFIFCLGRRIAEGYDKECHIGKSTEGSFAAKERKRRKKWDGQERKTGGARLNKLQPDHVFRALFFVTFWGPRDILTDERWADDFSRAL
jgi:hypothetical protein